MHKPLLPSIILLAALFIVSGCIGQATQQACLNEKRFDPNCFVDLALQQNDWRVCDSAEQNDTVYGDFGLIVDYCKRQYALRKGNKSLCYEMYKVTIEKNLSSNRYGITPEKNAKIACLGSFNQTDNCKNTSELVCEYNSAITNGLKANSLKGCPFGSFGEHGLSYSNRNCLFDVALKTRKSDDCVEGPYHHNQDCEEFILRMNGAPCPTYGDNAASCYAAIAKKTGNMSVCTDIPYMMIAEECVQIVQNSSA